MKFGQLIEYNMRAIFQVVYEKVLLTHFSLVSHFYTPWKRQKTFGFLTFSGGIEIWHWTKMG